jgi:hypothetical protein
MPALRWGPPCPKPITCCQSSPRLPCRKVSRAKSGRGSALRICRFVRLGRRSSLPCWESPMPSSSRQEIGSTLILSLRCRHRCGDEWNYRLRWRQHPLPRNRLSNRQQPKIPVRDRREATNATSFSTWIPSPCSGRFSAKSSLGSFTPNCGWCQRRVETFSLQRVLAQRNGSTALGKNDIRAVAGPYGTKSSIQVGHFRARALD